MNMSKISFIVGITAVIFYFLGYLQSKRSRIILFNVTARILYIVQYVLLGAYEGALLDVAGAVSSLLAQRKEITFVRKHSRVFFIGINLVIICSGFAVYKNVFSLLPVIGVLLHTGAFWIEDEKRIRQISFLGSPFWLVYNIVSRAYGSCVGDVMSMISIGISIIRYDIHKSKVF